MKENQANRVTFLLSFLVLLTRGKGISYAKHGQNSHNHPYGQVYKTIKLKCGDVYDCIDVNAQPSLNHPKLKGHKIQMQPSSFPVGLDTKPQFLDSESQVQPSIIDCPVGTVPVLRNNISGTVALYNMYGAGSTYMERAAAGIEYHGDVYGTTGKINVWQPKMNKDSMDFSATWVHINNEGGEYTDVIGAGIMVNPSWSGDTSVRYHITWTTGVDKKTCFDQICPGFVQVSRNWAPGGRLAHVSVYDGPQWAMIVKIFKDPKSNNWWLTDGTKPLGYWPNSLFTVLSDKGDFAFWGGIVQGPTATSKPLAMGSGHFATEGFRRAALLRYIQIINENNTCVTPEDDPRLSRGTSNERLYTVDKFRVDKDGVHMYYGGPGSVA